MPAHSDYHRDIHGPNQMHTELLRAGQTLDSAHVMLPDLAQAVCPQLHGAFLAKLALLLVLIGGIPRTEEGTHLRGAVHMLLLGDTATGVVLPAVLASELCPHVSECGVGGRVAGILRTAC